MASVGKFTDRGVQSLKTWVYMYRHAGKARMQTLGNYPAMTVADAHSAVAKATQGRARWPRVIAIA